MSKPGFYNDNEYRAYPFVAKTPKTLIVEGLATTGPALPDDAIVDAGFVMGLDAEYDDRVGKVFLSEIVRQPAGIKFVFSFSGGSLISPLNFVVPLDTFEYSTVIEESASSGSCGAEPLWDGFLVVGKLDALLQALDDANNVLTFQSGRYQIEPARVQNMNKAYLRSISVGNFERVKTPPCGDTEDVSGTRQVILNGVCLQGPIQFKEGYQTSITQTDRTNTLAFSSAKTSGLRADDDLCEYRGEIPLYSGEENDKPLIHGTVGNTPARRSEFLSGGWACKDLIFTINGVGGSNVNIIGGKNIQISYDETAQAIKVALAENARGQCNG